VYEKHFKVLDSNTVLPRELISYAQEHFPETPVGVLFSRAIHRVLQSSGAERAKMLRDGAKYARDLKDLIRCPYSIEREAMDRFGELLERKKENPMKVVFGALMAELGMSADEASAKADDR
jgi:flagellar biosynthesis/type III secretory pathway ATPase